MMIVVMMVRTLVFGPPDFAKELVPFTQLVKVRRGKLVLAFPSIPFL